MLQLNDLLIIFFILAIFLVAYGIVTEAILYPPQGGTVYLPDGSAIKRLFYRAYLASFGEMELAEMEGIISLCLTRQLVILCS